MQIKLFGHFDRLWSVSAHANCVMFYKTSTANTFKMERWNRSVSLVYVCVRALQRLHAGTSDRSDDFVSIGLPVERPEPNGWMRFRSFVIGRWRKSFFCLLSVSFVSRYLCRFPFLPSSKTSFPFYPHISSILTCGIPKECRTFSPFKNPPKIVLKIEKTKKGFEINWNQLVDKFLSNT